MGFAPAPRLIVLTRPLLIAAMAASTCACAGLPDVAALGPPPIDATSPVARQVALASMTPAPFPSFRNIPMPPTDVRPVRAWSASIYDTLRLRRQMQVAVALAGPPQTDTQAFYDETKARTAPPASASAAAAAALGNQTGDFVAGARQRATPPSSAR